MESRKFYRLTFTLAILFAGLFCFAQNRPSSVTSPVKHKELKNFSAFSHPGGFSQYARSTSYVPDTIIESTTLGNKQKIKTTRDAQGKLLTLRLQIWQNPQWVDSLLQTGTYDTQGNLINILFQVWLVNQWVNSSQMSFTWDAQGNVILEVTQAWTGTAWANVLKDSLIYDVSGNLLTEFYQSWHGGQWANSTKYLYTYDANNYLITETLQNWIASDWLNFSLTTYTYDPSGNLINQLNQNWESGAWMNSSQYTKTFNSYGNVLTEIDQGWDATEWVNTNKWTYTYDANQNLISELGQVWNGTEWANDYLDTYSFDDQGNALIYVEQVIQGSSWVNFEKVVYVYDYINKKITASYYQWSGSWSPSDGYIDIIFYGEWMYFASDDHDIIIYYSVVSSGISEIHSDGTTISLYPNPANTALNISISVSSAATGTVSFINELGVVVKQMTPVSLLPGTSILQADISTLPAGLYLVRFGNHSVKLTVNR